jgi:hypothetical protein
MVYFQHKNSDFGKFWSFFNKTCWYILWPFGHFYCHLVLKFYGTVVYFVVIWYILWSFGIFCGHLVYFVVIWYILWSFGFGILYLEKSRNHGAYAMITATP